MWSVDRVGEIGVEISFVGWEEYCFGVRGGFLVWVCDYVVDYDWIRVI